MGDDDKFTLLTLWKELISDDNLEECYQEAKSTIDKYMKLTGNNKLVSTFLFLTKLNILHPEEQEIVANRAFIKELLKPCDNKEILFVRALYNTSSVISSRHLKDIESKIIRKYQDGDMLNMTKGLETVCSATNGGKVLDLEGNEIPADKIFEYGGQCYNIDKLTSLGDQAFDIKHEYYETILTNHVNMSNGGFTDELLNMAAITSDADSLDLSHNKLEKLSKFVLGLSIVKLNLSNNPLTKLELKFNDKLEELILDNTSIERLHRGDIPTTIRKLSVSGCRSLAELNLADFHNLEEIDISGCVLLRRFFIPSSLSKLKKVTAHNTHFTTFEVRVSNISIFADKIDTYIVSQTHKLPNMNCQKCNSVTISNCDFEVFDKREIPNMITSLTFEHCINIHLSVKLNNLDNLKELRILRVKQCKSLTNLSTNIFASGLLTRDKPLHVISDSEITCKPAVMFNVTIEH